MTAALLLLALLAEPTRDSPPPPFVIRIVDDETGRGVPLVELRTTNGIVLVTDNAGVVAFDEPGLLGTRVHFTVSGHGYEAKADGFGIRGVALNTRPGGTATVKIHRLNVAERLYRITGQGLYHHSLRAGLPTPVKQPALNGRVMGQDSAVAVVHRGRIRWFWGDTAKPGYPLGHFGTATATSRLPTDGGLDPAVGIDLVYAVDKNGFSRPTFTLDRKGPVWVHGGFVLGDPEGRDRIVAEYERVDGRMKRLELGIAVFDDEREAFTPVVRLDVREERHPFGQPFLTDVEGVPHVTFSLPYPLLRVRTRWEDVMDPSHYEAFTCLRGSAYDPRKPDIVRDDSGRAVYAWRRGGLPVLWERQQEMIRAGHLKEDEAWIRTVDSGDGKRIHLHRGSVRWNPWRKRWIMIATRMGGRDSFLGDVYYAESEAPEGPWKKAVRIVRHHEYSFYNPVHHPFFDQEGGRVIYFEGTYTRTFSKSKTPTPRYDYNQILYRLDLSDPRLAPAATSMEDRAFLDPPAVVTASAADPYQPSARKFQGIPSLTRSRGGRLWAVWYASPSGGEDRNNYVVASTSGDDGATWDDPTLVVDPDRKGPVRAFDPQAWLDPDGRLWITWAQAVGHDGTVAGVWSVTTSNPDDARPRWSKPRRLTDGVMMGKPFVLSTGEWALPASTWRQTDNSARIVVSADHGRTWTLRGGCQIPPGMRAFDEHQIVERRDRSLWLLARSKTGFLLESVSRDGGRTWPVAKPSTLEHPSARFFIRRLSSGNLLMVKHHNTKGRRNLTAMVSKDDGTSWTQGLLLDPRGTISYPDGIQADDGRIFIIYDRNRTRDCEILLAVFTEAEVLAGRPGPKTRLQVLVSKGRGIAR